MFHSELQCQFADSVFILVMPNRRVIGPNKGLEIVFIIYFDDGETKPGPLNSIYYPSGLGIYRVVSLINCYQFWGS